MNVHVAYELDATEEMLGKRGLEPGGRVQKMFTMEIYRQSEPYTPFQQGILAHGPANVVEDDYILYNTPYAKYLWNGKLMVDPITGKGAFHNENYGFWSRPGMKKVLTDRDLVFYEAPQRGPRWTERMWDDKKSVILDEIAKEAGGVAEK